MKKLYPIILLFLAITTNSFSQDSLGKFILMNGKEISNIKILNIGAQSISYQNLNNNKIKKIYKDNVFAVNYVNGKENVIYKRDSIFNDLTVEQMRMLIKGFKDGREKHKNYSSYFIGFAAGVAGPIIASVSFGTLAPFPPAAGIFVCGITAPNMNKEPVEKKYLNNEEYLMGYQKKARGKKTRHALIGALVGFATGFAILKYSGNF